MRLWTAESGFESLRPNHSKFLPVSPLPVQPRATRFLGLGWLILGLVLTIRFAGYAADDVYITYRYAQNFSLGRPVFSPGERVFGKPSPRPGARRAASSPLADPWLGPC